MAESTSAPALPSTADTAPYVPVSWMAVGAFAVAASFVAILLALGISAFLAKKPLIQDELLALPAIGIVLSFAARRVIRNSEGTRTGERLANNAWWICVVVGLGYAAYLAGIAYSIRRDAKQVLDRWIGNLQSEDESDYNAAFLWTREPAQRANISPDNTKEIRGRFREEITAFEQADLVRLTRRNKGDAACRLTIGTLREWAYRSGGIDCTYTGVLKCPEGTFPFMVSLRGLEAVSGLEGAGRQWGIMYPSNGFIVREQQSLTRYGWLIVALEESGGAFASQFMLALRAGPWAIPYLYHGMMKVDPSLGIRYWEPVLRSAQGRMAVCGGLAAAHPYTNDYLAYSFADQFLHGEGGRTLSPAQRALFKTAWDSAAILPAGARIRNSPDTHPILSITESAVEVRLPCEIPLPGGDGNGTARGRILAVSTDPSLVAELKRLKSEADPDAGTTTRPPIELIQRDYKWRITRIESDLIPIVVQQRPGDPGAAPNMPPMPLGNPNP